MLKKITVYSVLAFIAALLAFYFIDRRPGMLIDEVFENILHIQAESNLMNSVTLFLIFYVIVLMIFWAIRSFFAESHTTYYQIIKMIQGDNEIK